MKLEGCFGLYHVIYLVSSLLLTVLGIIIIKKKVNNEKTLDIILRITALFLLIFVTVNRIYTTSYRINVTKELNTWWAIFPDSLCSTSSFTLSIAVLISPKKNNIAYYFVLYLGLYGTLITIVYPDFLDTQAFSLVNSWTGLLHHSIMLFLILIIIFKNRFTPSLKKAYIAPIGYMFFIVFGLLNISIFKLPNSMNILKPLLSSLPILTSWYILGIVFTISVYLISFIYEYIMKKN